MVKQLLEWLISVQNPSCGLGNDICSEQENLKSLVTAFIGLVSWQECDDNPGDISCYAASYCSVEFMYTDAIQRLEHELKPRDLVMKSLPLRTTRETNMVKETSRMGRKAESGRAQHCRWNTQNLQRKSKQEDCSWSAEAEKAPGPQVLKTFQVPDSTVLCPYTYAYTFKVKLTLGTLDYKLTRCIRLI